MGLQKEVSEEVVDDLRTLLNLTVKKDSSAHKPKRTQFGLRQPGFFSGLLPNKDQQCNKVEERLA